MSIQETILKQRKGRENILKLKNRMSLQWQKLTRLTNFSAPKVFYPYYNILHTHPFFLRYYDQPPLRYSTINNADLCHWVSSHHETRTNKPFVIEPQDHPLAPTRESEPRKVLDEIERAFKTYTNPMCKKIIVESEGQLELFSRFFPAEVIEKTEIVRLGAVSKDVDFDKKIANIKTTNFLCMASDYQRKAVDVLIRAWCEFSNKSTSKLILACPNIPDEVSNVISKENVQIIPTAPLSVFEKHELLTIADVVIAPLHVDGGANVIEAFEYGLPVITMRSQRSFIRNCNGWEVDVPFYFYDKGYGVDWPSWDDFWKILDDVKKNNGFDKTIQDLVNVFESIGRSPEILLEMGKNSYKLAQGEFSLETRNTKLRKIYQESLQ